MTAAPIDTTVSLLVPGDRMLDPRSGDCLLVLWREIRAQDGRVHLVLSTPDGTRISRTMPGTKDVQILPPPVNC